MTGISAATTRRSYALTGLALTIGLGLAGCGSIDDALFGPSSEAPAQSEAPAPAASSDQPSMSSSMPGTLPMSSSSMGAASAGSAVSGSLTPVPIEQGSDTGTPVNHTIQNLRGELSGLQDKVVSASQQLADAGMISGTFSGVPVIWFASGLRNTTPQKWCVSFP